MRAEQRNGTYLYHLLTGLVPNNPIAQAEIDAGKALLQGQLHGLEWGGSDNQDALAAAIARGGKHANAAVPVNIVLDRELLKGVFAGESLSTYGQFNLGSVGAIWLFATEQGLALEAHKARSAFRSQIIAVCLFSFLDARGNVHYAAPAPREHSRYHIGIDYGIGYLLGIRAEQPGKNARDNSPRMWLFAAALERLQRAKMLERLFSNEEEGYLKQWIVSRTWSQGFVKLLSEVRCHIPTVVQVTARGLRAWQPLQVKPWDDPRPAVEIINRQDVREHRGVDPSVMYEAMSVEGSIVWVKGLSLWPSDDVRTGALDNDTLSTRFVGQMGLGRQVEILEVHTVKPFRNPFDRVVEFGFVQGFAEINHHVTLGPEGVTVDGRLLHRDEDMSTPTPPPVKKIYWGRAVLRVLAAGMNLNVLRLGIESRDVEMCREGLRNTREQLDWAEKLLNGEVELPNDNDGKE